MAGHSKWKNIKRKKEAEDTKRGKVFSKMSRLIMVAARQGGGDPSANPSLRLAIEKAKSFRMPKENIDRAIQKGSGAGNDGVSFEEVVYEGFGVNGEAFYIKALTDNRNRTVSEIRTILSKAGGSLGGAGSTTYIFSKDPANPSFRVDVRGDQLERLQNLVKELEEDEDVQEVFVNF